MYKTAFKSQNWKALHPNVRSPHEKTRTFSKRKLAEARKFKAFLKDFRARKQRQEPTIVRPRERQLTACPFCGVSLGISKLDRHMDRVHRPQTAFIAQTGPEEPTPNMKRRECIICPICA